MSDSAISETAEFSDRWRWYLRGVRAAVSVPGLILISAYVGFAGLAREAGLDLAQAVFMTVFIWALPAQVVLIGAILSGASMPAATFAVALSSIRLTPMVVALVPELRGPRTPNWVLYILAHFIAVTSWVVAMERLRAVPPLLRTSYYLGLGSTLTIANAIAVGLAFMLAGSLSPSVAAGLFLLTPMYFLTSLWGSARERAGHVAMVAGLILGPLFHLIIPSFDLLAAGLIGGGGAYLLHRLSHGRALT